MYAYIHVCVPQTLCLSQGGDWEGVEGRVVGRVLCLLQQEREDT